jgi:hypothetical protein
MADDCSYFPKDFVGAGVRALLSDSLSSGTRRWSNVDKASPNWSEKGFGLCATVELGSTVFLQFGIGFGLQSL